MSDLLYHYTDARGLLGILTTRTIWATSAEFVNDAEELEFARRIVANEIERLIAPVDDTAANESTVGQRRRADYLRALAEEISRSRDERTWRVYVACFCEDGDLLSQWRGYGAGCGYSVGFDRDGLARVERANASVCLAQVAYGAESAADALEEVLARVGRRRGGNYPAELAAAEFQLHVVPLLAKVKHETFAEEREVRLVCHDHRGAVEPSFRSDHLGVTPYVPLQLPAEAIREVIVGPGPHRDVRARGPRELLATLGLSGVAVRNTGSPLRV